MIREISSLQHPLVKHLVKLRFNRDYRHEEQAIVIEGIKLVNEVCSSHPTKMIVVTDEVLLPPGTPPEKALIVSEAVMKKLSGMVTPEGILAEVAMPVSDSLHGKRKIVALDHIGDPGNLGTILRTALALGWEGCFILPNSSDPFNEKALRAARGATFRLPIATGHWSDLEALIAKNNLRPLVANLQGAEVASLPKAERILLVLSSEAHGVSEDALRVCQNVCIPMKGDMESLNVAVAGGILMYALTCGN